MMEEMFLSPNRPFYQSTQLMTLSPLHEDIYYDYARRFFEEKRGQLDQGIFQRIYRSFDGYTWYVQAILNRLYEEKSVIGADIRGNVYGGGNNAEVTGNTNVTIGKKVE